MKDIILVTGATGFVGSYLVRYLVREGHSVRALKRPTSSMALVEKVVDQIEWVECDVLDVVGLEGAMKGVEKIYHCAAMVSFDPRDANTMLKTNKNGTANIVNLALSEGVSKLLHVSSIAAIGRTKKQKIIDEDTKWQQNKINSNYATSKYLAEQEVWRGIAEGLQAVIINPSVILGSGFWDQGTTRLFKNIWDELRFYPVGASGFVDVRDVAKMCIQLMESDIVAERFIANGENKTYHENFNLIAECLDKKPPSIKVTPLLEAIAWRVEWLKSRLFGTIPLVTKETAQASGRTHKYSNEKSRQWLDFQYTPIDQTIRETCELFLAMQKEGGKPAGLPI